MEAESVHEAQDQAVAAGYDKAVGEVDNPIWAESTRNIGSSMVRKIRVVFAAFWLLLRCRQGI